MKSLLLASLYVSAIPCFTEALQGQSELLFILIFPIVNWLSASYSFSASQTSRCLTFLLKSILGISVKVTTYSGNKLTSNYGAN